MCVDRRQPLLSVDLCELNLYLSRLIAPLRRYDTHLGPKVHLCAASDEVATGLVLYDNAIDTSRAYSQFHF